MSMILEILKKMDADAKAKSNSKPPSAPHQSQGQSRRTPSAPHQSQGQSRRTPSAPHQSQSQSRRPPSAPHQPQSQSLRPNETYIADESGLDTGLTLYSDEDNFGYIRLSAPISRSTPHQSQSQTRRTPSAPHQRRANPSIAIGMYTFSLIQRSMWHGYNMVQIQSDDTFWCYRSNSELGLWRLATMFFNTQSSNHQFYKGADYVQQTLINVELQKFINNHFTGLPLVNESQIILSYGGSFDKEFPDIEDINDQTRVKTTFPFLLFDKTCGTPITEPELLNYSDLFQQCYELVSTETVYPYTTKFMGMINVIGEIEKLTLNAKYSPSEVQFSEGSKLTESKIQKCPQLIETYFKPVVVLYILKVTLHQECLMRVRGIDDAVIRENIRKICSKPIHYMPFFLTEPENSITKYGLNTSFIPAGPLICKLFDYQAQCTPEEQISGRCTDLYSYTGDRFDNLFPIKSRTVSDEIVVSCEELIKRAEISENMKRYKIEFSRVAFPDKGDFIQEDIIGSELYDKFKDSDVDISVFNAGYDRLSDGSISNPLYLVLFSVDGKPVESFLIPNEDNNSDFQAFLKKGLVDGFAYQIDYAIDDKTPRGITNSRTNYFPKFGVKMGIPDKSVLTRIKETKRAKRPRDQSPSGTRKRGGKRKTRKSFPQYRFFRL